MLNLVAALQSYRYSYSDELEFQNGIAQALESSFISYQREVDLISLGMIDFVCDRIGIECKIKGGRHDLFRQIARYAEHADIDHIIIASSRRSLIQGAPVKLNGKQITSLFLGGFA